MCKTLSDHWDTLYWHHEDKKYIYYTLIVHAKQSKPDCLVNHLKNGYLPMKVLQQLNLQLQDLTNRACYSTSKLQIQRNWLWSSNNLLMKNYVSAPNPGSLHKCEEKKHLLILKQFCFPLNAISNTDNIGKKIKMENTIRRITYVLRKVFFFFPLMFLGLITFPLNQAHQHHKRNFCRTSR